MKRLSQAEIESLMIATDKLSEAEILLSTVKHPAASGIGVLVRDAQQRVHLIAQAAFERMQRIRAQQQDHLDEQARQQAGIAAAVARGMGQKE